MLATEKTVLEIVRAQCSVRWLALVIITTASVGMGLAIVWRMDRNRDRTPIDTGSTDAQTVVGHAVKELRAHPRIVVLDANVAISVRKTSDKKLWFLDLGRTEVLVLARGNVQFFVPLDQITPAAFHCYPAERRLALTIPRPQLDRDTVGVDPATLETWKRIGWARLDAYSGRTCEAAAKKELTAELLWAGNQELLRERAEHEAVPAVRNLLTVIVAAVGQELQVEVELQAKEE